MSYCIYGGMSFLKRWHKFLQLHHSVLWCITMYHMDALWCIVLLVETPLCYHLVNLPLPLIWSCSSLPVINFEGSSDPHPVIIFFYLGYPPPPPSLIMRLYTCQLYTHWLYALLHTIHYTKCPICNTTLIVLIVICFAKKSKCIVNYHFSLRKYLNQQFSATLCFVSLEDQTLRGSDKDHETFYVTEKVDTFQVFPCPVLGGYTDQWELLCDYLVWQLVMWARVLGTSAMCIYNSQSVVKMIY